MKKGYINLLIFEIIAFLILILNGFMPSILKNYNFIILLVVLLIFFKLIFGFEKDRHRYIKDVIIDIISLLIVFFIILYLSGIFIGFTKTENYFTIFGIKTFIIPLILGIFIKEILRYNILMKSEGSKLLIILSLLLFVCLDTVNILNFKSFYSVSQTFLIVSIYILPIIANNILCTYLSINVGYKPCILFMLLIKIYSYVLPIVPNISDYIYSIIFLWFPFVILYRVVIFFQKNNDDFVLSKKDKKFIILTPVAMCSLFIIVYFVSGYFKYFALVIGSDSMIPEIYKGDVVVVEKIDDKDTLKIGDVIVYEYNNVYVVHRLVNKMTDRNERYYYTKGDANEKIDNWIVTEDMIVGKVNLKIPYIGLPSTWLNNL